MQANLTPSKMLLKAVRGRLIMAGSSLSSWAATNGVKRQNLTKALVGDWTGPKAKALVNQIVGEVLNDE